MELTSSFLDLLPHFSPVFTAPTYQTFVCRNKGVAGTKGSGAK